jgi:hypothetical protein
MKVRSRMVKILRAVSFWTGAIYGVYMLASSTGLSGWFIDQERWLLPKPDDREMFRTCLGCLLLAFSPQLWERLRRMGMVGKWPFPTLRGKPYRADEEILIHPRFAMILFAIGLLPMPISDGVHSYLADQSSSKDYSWIPALGALFSLAIWGVCIAVLRKTIKRAEEEPF